MNAGLSRYSGKSAAESQPRLGRQAKYTIKQLVNPICLPLQTPDKVNHIILSCNSEGHHKIVLANKTQWELATCIKVRAHF